MGTASPLMTAEEFLALPDDGIERDLIRGEIKERGPVTKRNRNHAFTEATITRILGNWSQETQQGTFVVLSGEAGIVVSEDPPTTFGIDVVVLDRSVLEEQDAESPWVKGIPTLTVEILSPSDRCEDIHDKVTEYMRVGVPMVWVVDPALHTVTIHRSDRDPSMVNRSQQLTGDDVLPGFECAVADLFPDWN